jgi:hypothetical protein
MVLALFLEDSDDGCAWPPSAETSAVVIVSADVTVSAIASVCFFILFPFNDD